VKYETNGLIPMKIMWFSNFLLSFFQLK